MTALRLLCVTAMACAIAILFAQGARADDWMHKSYEVIGGGIFEFDHPESWGKKPGYEVLESLTDIKFGPYGPKSKPVFLLHVQAFVSLEPVSDDDIGEVIKIDLETLKDTAFETDIAINEISGPAVRGQYFSITDKNSKRGEYDYLTEAVLASGNLMVKCYFLSSDGAPDFGADAMQMMQSIKYTPPPPDPEKDENKDGD